MERLLPFDITLRLRKQDTKKNYFRAKNWGVTEALMQRVMSLLRYIAPAACDDAGLPASIENFSFHSGPNK